jgi:hypothetical protein
MGVVALQTLEAGECRYRVDPALAGDTSESSYRVNVTAAVVAGVDTYGLELDTPADH